HQLLYLLRTDSGPWGDDDGGLDRRVWIFALGHTPIAGKAPDTDPDQHDPGDVSLLDEEARNVTLALVNIVIAVSVCHVIMCRGFRGFLDQSARSGACFQQ